jgi:hypothetical protein
LVIARSFTPDRRPGASELWLNRHARPGFVLANDDDLTNQAMFEVMPADA